MTRRSERRRHPRQTHPGKVKVYWRTPEGHSFSLVSEVLDVSRSGLRVALSNKPLPGAMVQLESPDLRIAGVAYVRHVNASGLKWRVGLEFSGGLEWRSSENQRALDR